MASVHFLLIIFFFLVHHVHHVNAAENIALLIRTTCEASKPCLECLRTDPRSDDAASSLLAAIQLVDCAVTHAELLRGNFSGWAASDIKLGMYEQAAALEDCSRMFSYAKKDLFGATVGLMKRDFEGADRSVYNATMRPVACRRRREKTSVRGIQTMAMMVSYELGVFNQLTQAAMKIINSL